MIEIVQDSFTAMGLCLFSTKKDFKAKEEVKVRLHGTRCNVMLPKCDAIDNLRKIATAANDNRPLV